MGTTVRWLQEDWEEEEEEKKKMGGECPFILPVTCVPSQNKEHALLPKMETCSFPTNNFRPD